MAISTINAPIEIGNEVLLKKSDPFRISTADSVEEIPEEINLIAEIEDASEEIADILSVFGRSNKIFKKNNTEDGDSLHSLLDENAEEQFDTLKEKVIASQKSSDLLDMARQLFPDEYEVLFALEKLLLSRAISELKKKKIREAINEWSKFIDQKKMQSTMNISRIAKKFSQRSSNNKLSLTAMELRNSYLRFLELDLSSTFIYQDWMEQYGCANRTRLLAFTLSALVADIKSINSGINFNEFAPLSTKLSDARAINTLDLDLIGKFKAFTEKGQLSPNWSDVLEEDVVNLYLTGLINFSNIKTTIEKFSESYMSNLFLKQKAVIMQSLSTTYNKTPDFLYADQEAKSVVQKFMADLMQTLYKKEKQFGIWKEYYR